MPTVLRDGPYRFFFYSGDGSEPMHVHVQHDDREAKYWLAPVRLERNNGFSRHELRDIEQIINAHEQELILSWHGFFNQ